MGCAGRSGWPVGAHAGAWAFGTVGTVGSGTDASGGEAVASLPPCGLAVLVEAADGEQGRPKSRILASRPCRAAWSATGPAMVVWPAWSLLTCRPSNQADQRASKTPWTRSS
jgi:hypothetical protein